MQRDRKGLPDECAPDTSPTITLKEVVPGGRGPEACPEFEAPGADLGGPADPNQPRDEDSYAGDPIDILDNLADTLS
jgi:hypothetical protein